MAAKLKAKIAELGKSDMRDERHNAHALGVTRVHMLVEAERLELLEEQNALLRRIADALESNSTAADA